MSKDKFPFVKREKIFLPVIGFVLVVVVAGVFAGFFLFGKELPEREKGFKDSQPVEMSDVLMNLSENETVQAVFFNEVGKAASLTLEVANSEQERREGLMNRSRLETGRGMVFVWEEPGRRAFWMKNTYIPLDMIFISINGTVLNVEEAAPQPNASDENLKVYRSEGKAMYVVETNRGFSERKGIKEGTEVVFSVSH